MTFQALVNLVPIIVVALVVSGAIRRQLARLSPPPVERPSARPAPAAAPAQRRRLAPPPPVRPVGPSSSAPSPINVPASMGETLPAEAAAAFPALDLTLPGTPALASASRARRRIRTLAGGPAFGSPGWGVNAVVALEVLGTPVGLRSGATVGVPHAF